MRRTSRWTNGNQVCDPKHVAFSVCAFLLLRHFFFRRVFPFRSCFVRAQLLYLNLFIFLRHQRHSRMSHHRERCRVWAPARARAPPFPFVMKTVHKLRANYVHKLFYFILFLMWARAHGGGHTADPQNHTKQSDITNESIWILLQQPQQRRQIVSIRRIINHLLYGILQPNLRLHTARKAMLLCGSRLNNNSMHLKDACRRTSCANEKRVEGVRMSPALP